MRTRSAPLMVIVGETQMYRCFEGLRCASMAFWPIARASRDDLIKPFCWIFSSRLGNRRVFRYSDTIVAVKLAKYAVGEECGRREAVYSCITCQAQAREPLEPRLSPERVRLAMAEPESRGLLPTADDTLEHDAVVLQVQHLAIMLGDDPLDAFANAGSLTARSQHFRSDDEAAIGAALVQRSCISSAERISTHSPGFKCSGSGSGGRNLGAGEGRCGALSVD